MSLSMEPDGQNLRREDFAEAFRSPEVHEAIRSCMLGRIAATGVEWAGPGCLTADAPLLPLITE